MPLGFWEGLSTPCWLHLGKEDKSLPKRTTYHSLCRFSISTNAQHPGTDDLSIDPSCLSEALCHWRRLYALLKVLREAPEHGDLILFTQDLAGFFTSIDQARFFGCVVYAP